MQRLLPDSVRGGISLLLFSLNTIVWVLPLLLAHALKLLLPAPGWRRFWSEIQHRIGVLWISLNNWNLRLLNPARWDVEGLEGLEPNDWYLVVANHQSWVDILVLQRVLNRKIPFMKFFLKKELFWVPFLGLAWWSLDYPFLERSSSASKDVETIRRACERFKSSPVSIMNFVEGTRFTPEKRDRQGSRYQHVLKPKAGGLTVLLSGMEGRISFILDVTIAYPGTSPRFWDFLCGRLEEIRVRAEVIPVGEDLVGDYGADKEYRRRFTRWLNDRWTRKDELMAGLLETKEGAGHAPEADA